MRPHRRGWIRSCRQWPGRKGVETPDGTFPEASLPRGNPPAVAALDRRRPRRRRGSVRGGGQPTGGAFFPLRRRHESRRRFPPGRHPEAVGNSVIVQRCSRPGNLCAARRRTYRRRRDCLSCGFPKGVCQDAGKYNLQVCTAATLRAGSARISGRGVPQAPAADRRPSDLETDLSREGTSHSPSARRRRSGIR